MADDRNYIYGRDEGYDSLEEPVLRAGHGEAPHESVGELLRRTREYYNQDLRQIADSLRIRYAYLDAIERGQFEVMPGPTYAVGFVRSYASFLGLDDDEVVRRFKQEVEGLDRTQQLHFPEPVNEGKVPGGAILLIALLLVAVSYGGWHYMNSQGHSVADLVPAVPERLQALIEEPEQTDTLEPGAFAAAGDDVSADVGAADSDASRPLDRTPAARTEMESADAERTEAERASTARAEAEGVEAERTEADGADVEESATAEAPPAEGGFSSAARAAPEPPASSLAQPDEMSQPEAMPMEGAEGEAAVPGDGTERAQPPAEGLVSDVREETGEQTALPSGSEELDTVPSVPEQGEEDSAIPAAPGARTQSAGEAQSGIRVFGEENADSRIVLRAVQDTWVQVRGDDDSLLLTRVLNPGDVYRVPNRDNLLLHTGNAGGLEIIVDGEQTASLGGAGEVRRNIPLDPDGLRDRSM